jgi:hypothetical protein
MYFTNFPPKLRILPRLAWPWLAGLVLLCLAALSWLIQAPELRARDDGLDRRIALLELKLRTPLASAHLATQSQDIGARLETPERISAVARDLQAIATHNGIALLDASYKPDAHVENRDMGQVDIGVRLKGGYQPMKKTIAALLGMHESLALESLDVRRSNSTDAVLEIDLRFNFFYRKQA